MPSQTNEATQEQAIEKKLTGTTIEALNDSEDHNLHYVRLITSVYGMRYLATKALKNIVQHFVLSLILSKM